MRKKFNLFIGILFLLVFVKVVLASLNLGFEINLNKPTYYPNETMQMNVTVTNRELRYSASNLNLALFIGKRTYDFDLGNLKSGQSITKSVVLPEQPAGSYLIRGVLTYTGYFGETATLENYNNIEVKFPELKRLPRNIYISNFSLPENTEQGKSYQAIVIVTNNDTITGELSIVVESLGSNSTKEIKLEPNKTEIIQLNITFLNAGLSIAEARVYGLVDDVKYLLNYLSKSIFVKEVKHAKLFFDKVELYDESDSEINQNDEVKIRIYVKNIGESPAYNVKGILSSNETGIIITKPAVDYKLILDKESLAAEPYEIRLSNLVGTYNLNLNMVFNDARGEHSINLFVPIEIKKDLCNNNNQCASNEICSKGTCTKLVCDENSYAQDHQCKKYECVKDSDCKQYYTCDTKLHVCKPPECTSDLQCDDNEVCSAEGKCKEAFTLVFVPVNWKENEFEKFKKKAQFAATDFLTKTPLNACSNKEERIRVHYIEPKNCQVGTCDDHCTDCIKKARKCVLDNGLGGVYDKFAALTKGSWGGGCANGIPGDGSSTDSGYPDVVIHEIGHTVGLCHVKGCGASGWEYSWCPNKQDSEEDLITRATFIMDYCPPMNKFGHAGYNFLKTNYKGVEPYTSGLSKWVNGCFE